MVLTWMNSIALNIHRSYIRREPLLQALPELSTAPKVNLAAIDVRRILKSCKHNDRMSLAAPLPRRLQSSGDCARTRLDGDSSTNSSSARPPHGREAPWTPLSGAGSKTCTSGGCPGLRCSCRRIEKRKKPEGAAIPPLFSLLEERNEQEITCNLDCRLGFVIRESR